MTLKVSYAGTRVDLSCADGAGGSLPVDDAAVSLWGSWSARYGAATAKSDAGALRALGREIYVWLNGGGMAADWAKGGLGARRLEIASSAWRRPGRLRSRTCR